MEQFYKLLREYNLKSAGTTQKVPAWHLQYTEPEPPQYWRTVFDLLKDEPKNRSIVEIGCGYGDVTALLYYLGYRNITSFERDSSLADCTSQKVFSLFKEKANAFKGAYPQKLAFTPGILLQVNCVYADGLSCKPDYINQIRDFYNANGTPDLYIAEFIDCSFKEYHRDFPMFVRLSENEVRDIFPGCRIKSYVTYQYPRNKVSKKLYVICN